MLRMLPSRFIGSQHSPSAAPVLPVERAFPHLASHTHCLSRFTDQKTDGETASNREPPSGAHGERRTPGGSDGRALPPGNAEAPDTVLLSRTHSISGEGEGPGWGDMPLLLLTTYCLPSTVLGPSFLLFSFVPTLRGGEGARQPTLQMQKTEAQGGVGPPACGRTRGIWAGPGR